MAFRPSSARRAGTQSRGRESAGGQKTDARARFPRYARNDGSKRWRVSRLLRALDRGLPSAALL